MYCLRLSLHKKLGEIIQGGVESLDADLMSYLDETREKPCEKIDFGQGETDEGLGTSTGY